MVINYKDKNLIVTYLQVYLLEYSGLTVRKVTPKSKKLPVYYEITSNEQLAVTGYYNLQTYTALALYMAYNYPNEGFPIKWSRKPLEQDPSQEWISEDYVYTGNQQELIDVISSNMELSVFNRDTIRVPERVLSYIFNEVVTSSSSPEEVLRIKQLLYDYIYSGYEHPPVLTYNEDVFNKVIGIQKKIISRYTTKYSYSTELIEMKSDSDGNPITQYDVGKQLNNVVCWTTSNDNNILHGVKINDKTVRITIETDEIKSAIIIYEDSHGQSLSQEATSFEREDIYLWLLKFNDTIGTLEQITVTYEEPYNYDLITGYVTFFNFKEGKEIQVDKTINSVIAFPEQFKDFKVTGYVDPWTEVLIKGEYEDGDW